MNNFGSSQTPSSTNSTNREVLFNRKGIKKISNLSTSREKGFKQQVSKEFKNKVQNFITSEIKGETSKKSSLQFKVK